MNEFRDCSNAAIRDLLPDLLHERLDAGIRAEVDAHVASCTDCREELALLRGMQSMVARATPRMDVAYIMGALPRAASGQRTAAVARRRPVWSDWRIAAAVAAIAVGGTSAAVLARGRGNFATELDTVVTAQARAAQVGAGRSTAPVASAPRTLDSASAGAESAAAAKVAAPAPTPTPTQTVATASDAASSVSGASADAGSDPSGPRLNGLSTRQLQTLLGEIDHLQTVPVTDPDPIAIRVDTRATPEGA
jgi:hypothetical protein